DAVNGSWETLGDHQRKISVMQEIVHCPYCAKLVSSTANGHCPDCGAQLSPEAGEPLIATMGQTPQPQTLEETLLTLTPRVVVTPAIVLINVLVFAAMVMSGVGLLTPQVQDVLDWGANYGPRTLRGEWW